MQVHIYLDESGDNLIVEIPTSDGTFRAFFDHDKLADSHSGNPLVGQMPEPTGSTVYSKPIGEMPLKVQEEYSRKLQEEAARDQANQSQDASAPKEPANPTASDSRLEDDPSADKDPGEGADLVDSKQKSAGKSSSAKK